MSVWQDKWMNDSSIAALFHTHNLKYYQKVYTLFDNGQCVILVINPPTDRTTEIIMYLLQLRTLFES